jgi:hypothetical protein
VTRQGGVLESLKSRGEEVFSRVSGELMSSPHFTKALQAAMQGKQVLDQAAARALKQMNIPTRTEFKKALQRIEGLERELVALKAKPRPARKRRTAPRKPAAPAAGPAPVTSEPSAE